MGFLTRTIRGHDVRVAVFAVLAGWLVLSVPCGAARSGTAPITLAVVVGRSSRLEGLERAQLKRLFTSERISDPGGRPLIPINHPPRTPDRVGFDRVALGMGPEEVGRFWVDRKIRGQSGAPRTVDNLDTLRRLVEKLPGAIAYVRTSQLSPSLKPVRIDGRVPGDAGYAISY